MKKALRWFAIGLAAILVLLLIAGGSLYAIGTSRLAETYDVQPEITTVEADSALVARGEHIARIHSCMHCHGIDLSGAIFVDAPPFLLAAPNLTAGEGGIGDAYTDADWDRAVRHGVRPNGQSLMTMPSSLFAAIDNADMTAMIAYLKQIPPVDNVLPSREIRPLGRLLVGASALDPAMEVTTTVGDRSPAPPYGPTAEYGAYLAASTCVACHGGPSLRGGPHPEPGAPPGPDLTAAAGWPLDVFKQALRTGVAPDGRVLADQYMPWTDYVYLTDVELEALHAHIQEVTRGDAMTATGR